MTISALLNNTSGNYTSNDLYSITQNLITQSTSVESSIYTAVHQMNSSTTSSETVQSAYTSIDSFLKTYQADLTELEQTSANLMLSNKQSIFAEYEAGEVELDDIVSAVEDFVDSYNSVTSLLKVNKDRGAGTASHLDSFTRGISADKVLKAVGITYYTDGKMTLDSEVLKKALEEDYNGTSSMIGGQYGIADRTSMKAVQALEDSVQRIVSNDLNTLINNTQKFDSIQYTYHFSRAGVYNLSNMYAVGLFVNTMV